jgi:ATP phosphoribosyltransferase
MKKNKNNIEQIEEIIDKLILLLSNLENYEELKPDTISKLINNLNKNYNFLKNLDIKKNIDNEKIELYKNLIENRDTFEIYQKLIEKLFTSSNKLF